MNPSRSDIAFAPIFTVCNNSCEKVMFSKACVKNSAQGRHPPTTDTPLGRHFPPLPRRPLQHRLPWLLECILVWRHIYTERKQHRFHVDGAVHAELLQMIYITYNMPFTTFCNSNSCRRTMTDSITTAITIIRAGCLFLFKTVIDGKSTSHK